MKSDLTVNSTFSAKAIAVVDRYPSLAKAFAELDSEQQNTIKFLIGRAILIKKRGPEAGRQLASESLKKHL
jgi:hypothetical protein